MRDYIGSADAHYIYKGNYASLIKSKLRDSSFMSAHMTRGLALEQDIIKQGAEGLSSA